MGIIISILGWLFAAWGFGFWIWTARHDAQFRTLILLVDRCEYSDLDFARVCLDAARRCHADYWTFSPVKWFSLWNADYLSDSLSYVNSKGVSNDKEKSNAEI